MPVLLAVANAVWHSHSRPLTKSPPCTLLSCHRAPLCSPALLRCAGSHPHFLAQADTPHLSDVIFLCQRFIHVLCFYSFVVDVTKGSPLFPACFFPFYFLRVYVYVCRSWLGDRRSVWLVSYQRDLGVWMFPGVRRVWFLLAIALKLNALFVPFFFLFSFIFLFIYLFFFESYVYFFRVQNLACSLRYGIKKPPTTPGKKPTPQVPLLWNQPHISPPTRNPGLAKKIDERNKIKEQAGRVRKTHGTIIRTKEKQKANLAGTT